jgi:hypothetical protein
MVCKEKIRVLYREDEAGQLPHSHVGRLEAAHRDEHGDDQLLVLRDVSFSTEPEKR